MNTTPEERPTGPSSMPIASSASVKITSLDREEVRKNLKQAVAALARRRPEIERVILFGSLATDRAVPGSDADLLLVLTHADRTFLDRIPRYIPEGCRIGVDVFPYTHAEIAAMQAAGNALLRRALAEGVELYRSPNLSQT